MCKAGITLTAITALAYAACAGNAQAKGANASAATERVSGTGFTEGDVVALEKSAFQAWKSKNATFWDSFLSEKFVGWGTSGRLNKASATKEYTGADCDIKSYG